MGDLSVKEEAAIAQIAACLAGFVTNGIIDEKARVFGFTRLTESSKPKKLRAVLTVLMADGRSRSTAGKLLEQLVLEAFHRTVSGVTTMTHDHVDRIVLHMRTLGLPTAELARSNWREGLARQAEPPPHAPPASSPPSAPSRVATAAARRHDEALLYVAQLSTGVFSAQHRGRELEKIVTAVIRAEGLLAARNVVNPGEQIDVVFALDGFHFLLECKWEQSPVGMPVLRDLSEKVRRKAEGTLGVLLSMSGFAQNINTTAAYGSRLNSVGLSSREFMNVLEGRSTFTAEVRAARAGASARGLFHVGA